jgi:hypothetical protein
MNSRINRDKTFSFFKKERNIRNSPSETVEKENKRFNLETVEMPHATRCGKCRHHRLLHGAA